jgi:Na+-driven multidrug efflux pump
MNLHYNRANDLTQGSIMGTMLRFAVPMILGNLLQQCYNIADTLIVGHYLGADALAAVGSAYGIYHIGVYRSVHGQRRCLFDTIRS